MIELSYTFTFLRHGESVGNAEERFQGQSDFPLTDTGRAQAQALAERWFIEGVKFDLAVTSSLVRERDGGNCRRRFENPA